MSILFEAQVELTIVYSLLYLYHVQEARTRGCHGGSRTSALGLLGKEAELALLGDVAQLAQLLDCLLASSVLAAADDATLLGLHQILLGQATGSVLGRSMVYLGLGSNGGYLGTSHHVVLTVATSHVGHLGFYLERIFFTSEVWEFGPLQ